MSRFVGLACDWGNRDGTCTARLYGADAEQLVKLADRNGWRLIGPNAYCDRHNP